MVVTATRVPTPDTDIPAGVTVIDRQTIETRGYNTLVDALQDVPGLRVSPSGGPGLASVFIRGTNSFHVLVLRDGMPINDASDPNGAFNFGVDTLADVERIEIIRGPMAALYGSGAIGGVINIITRRGTEPGVHWDGDLSGGYPAQIRGSSVLSGMDGPVDYALIFELQSQRGYDTTPQRESIYTGVPQGYRDRIATLNLGYTVVPGTRLSLLLRAQDAIYGFNELGDPTFDDSNATGYDASLLGRIGVNSSLFDGTYQTSVFLGREQNDRRYYEPLNLADPNLTTVDDRYHSYRTDLQWNNTVHLNDFFSSTVLSATDLTFGYERTADAAKVRTNDNYGGFPYAENANASQTDDAVYLGLQSTVWQRLILTSQIRQDWEAPNTPTTWRLGAVVDAPEIDTHFKAAYGTAFRVPSLFDRYGVDSFGYVGNPNLKPEAAQGWETGFTSTLPALGRPDFASFGATYFNEQVNNLIVAVDMATGIAPARSQAGRRSRARSSIAHIRKGSPTTSPASRNPVAAANPAMSSSRVAGTIRSTIVSGKTAARASVSTTCGATFWARESTTRLSVELLPGTLSQLIITGSVAPRAMRRLSTARMKPGRESGRSG